MRPRLNSGTAADYDGPFTSTCAPLNSRRSCAATYSANAASPLGTSCARADERTAAASWTRTLNRRRMSMGPAPEPRGPRRACTSFTDLGPKIARLPVRKRCPCVLRGLAELNDDAPDQGQDRAARPRSGLTQRSAEAHEANKLADACTQRRQRSPVGRVPGIGRRSLSCYRLTHRRRVQMYLPKPEVSLQTRARSHVDALREAGTLRAGGDARLGAGLVVAPPTDGKHQRARRIRGSTKQAGDLDPGRARRGRRRGKAERPESDCARRGSAAAFARRARGLRPRGP